MIRLTTQVHVDGLTARQVYDFMIHCSDADYQAWWPGVHLAFHTVERYPGEIGNRVYFDEFVGQRRLKFSGVGTAARPGREIVWQMAKGVRLPAWLRLEFEDTAEGVRIVHTVQAGFDGFGRLLDPFLRLYFSLGFERDLDLHARAEFPMLIHHIQGEANAI